MKRNLTFLTICLLAGGLLIGCSPSQPEVISPVETPAAQVVVTEMTPEDWVYGIVVNGQPKAYPEKLFENQLSITDEIAETKVRVIHNANLYKFENLDTNSDLEYVRSSWADWQALHPTTQLFRGLN